MSLIKQQNAFAAQPVSWKRRLGSGQWVTFWGGQYEGIHSDGGVCEIANICFKGQQCAVEKTVITVESAC